MSLYRRFRDQCDGGVAIMIGFVFFLLVGAVGGAVDYSNATKQRDSLQAAADASALAAARLGEDKTQEEYNEAAEAVFMASSVCRDIECTAPEVSVDESGNIQVDAGLNVETFLLNIIGVNTIPIDVMAKALPPANFGVDVMMVLDYSGSMSWNDKYISMANAAKDFLERSEARNGDNMRVGIVPFSQYVLTPLRGQFAYDVQNDSVLTGLDIVGCTSNREHPYSVSADTPEDSITGSLWPVNSYTTGAADGASAYTSENQAQIDSITAVYEGATYEFEYFDVDPSASTNSTPIWGSLADGPLEVQGYNRFALRWVGEVPDRFVFNNALDWPTSRPSQLNGYGTALDWETPADGSLPDDFEAHELAEQLNPQCGQYAENSTWARAMTTEFDVLKGAIDNMRPLGATNIALGLDFGWHYLTDNEPFSEASTEDNTKRSLILLSDGTQTVPAHGGNGSYNIDSANKNITEICGNIKGTNIEIYTIAFGIEDQFTRNLLKNCSTGDEYYYEPRVGSELDAVFDEIFDSISPSKTRITG